MPPKAHKKEKPVKGDEAEDVNRPYASTDVSANLKNRVTKAEAQKALTALADKGSLTIKPYGKQTIFVYNQSQLPVLDPAEMAELDAGLKEVQGILDERRKELKSLQSNLGLVVAMPKTAALNKEIETVNAGNELTLKALKPFRGESAAPPMSEKDAAKIDGEWERWRKEWTTRKKVYETLYGILADGGLCTGSRQDFEDEQGIEPDDEATIEVEQGEFCKPVVTKRKTSQTSNGSDGQTLSNKAKRART